jgi:hypothetical protein
MKKYRKALLFCGKIAFCVVLIFSGYALNDYLWDREHRFPNMPKLPSAFKDYHFENIDAPWNLRNEEIKKFYHAWQEKETYGIYEASVGLDSLIRSFWLTENGKVKLIRVIEAPFWRKKIYPVWEINNISLGYWNKNEEFIKIDPDADEQHDLIINCDDVISKSVAQQKQDR